MKLTNNTIFITGGTSGIGRGLAEALHALGNQVIISGRRQRLLDEVTAANPGMAALKLDLQDSASIAATCARVVELYPALNVLINNAGVMHIDNAAGPQDDAMLVSTLTTNLLGPMRVTAGLIEHLKRQPSATLINVSSALAFVPMTMAAAYSATKAALHSYTLSLRYSLAGTSVAVREIAPPWVQTDLINSKDEPRAMPLDQFIDEAMALLATDADEVLVGGAQMFRANPGPNEGVFVTQFNDLMAQPQ